MNFPVSQPRSECAFKPVTRILVLASGVILAWVFYQGTDVVTLLGALAFAGGIFCGFSYTEFDSEQIAKIFRIGPFWRIKYSEIKWNDVAKAEAYNNRGLATLRLVTKDGTRNQFTVPEKSTAGDSFYEISRYFERIASKQA